MRGLFGAAGAPRYTDRVESCMQAPRGGKKTVMICPNCARRGPTLLE